MAEQLSAGGPREFTPPFPLSNVHPSQPDQQPPEEGCSTGLLPPPFLWSSGELSLPECPAGASLLCVPIRLVSLLPLCLALPFTPCCTSPSLLPELTAPNLKPPMVFSRLIVLVYPVAKSCGCFSHNLSQACLFSLLRPHYVQNLSPRFPK